tara:strand:+ start:6382 stop:6513 length:132 start_codon:yes stop_codon:yes gene_type:complete
MRAPEKCCTRNWRFVHKENARPDDKSDRALDFFGLAREPPPGK